MGEKLRDKTNACRIVEEAGFPVQLHCYAAEDGAVDGRSVAEKTGRSPEQVFKTLVTVGPNKDYYVFVLPVSGELDLKKAALAAKVKGIEMLPLQEINKVTGYIRGGCSPVGMKRRYPTILAEEAMLWDTILVSAGRIGAQLELAPEDLLQLTAGIYGDILR